MFSLTSQERKTIVFILCLLLLGLGLDFFKKHTQRPNLLNLETLKDKLFNRVDINRANISELKTVPGIGQNLAEAIITYRNSHGYFKNIEELKNVKGIKSKKLAQIKQYITIANNLP